MRKEEEMYRLILDVAKNNSNIRAVYINGSRANPKAKRDIFQDYDIVYVVRQIKEFLDNPEWINIFGNPIIIQEPSLLDKMDEKPVDFLKEYAYLMQFTDGNRIDLTLLPTDVVLEEFGKDKLTRVLLDKDELLPAIEEPSDKDYYIKKPTYGNYYSRCNEFWWVAPYCAKGLWRHEILYAIDILNEYVRKELLTILSWQVGIVKGFDFSLEKSKKRLPDYLEQELWNKILKTYEMGNEQKVWDALIEVCEIFQEIALWVGKELGYDYPREEAKRSFEFIKHIRNLPQDASDIYQEGEYL